MLTNEQLKNLKEGDPILIHTTFDSLSESGNIRYFSSFATEKGDFITDCRATAPSFVSLPEKDPGRLFKKGDIVRVVKYKGRPFSKFWEPYIGSEMQVVDNETDCENPSIKTPKGWQPINAAYLELITPAEEIVPYSVRHNDAHAAYSIYGPYGLSAANYFYGERYPYSKHSAEAAAYAECDRLNAAYREEQE